MALALDLAKRLYEVPEPRVHIIGTGNAVCRSCEAMCSVMAELTHADTCKWANDHAHAAKVMGLEETDVN